MKQQYNNLPVEEPIQKLNNDNIYSDLINILDAIKKLQARVTELEKE